MKFKPETPTPENGGGVTTSQMESVLATVNPSLRSPVPSPASSGAAGARMKSKSASVIAMPKRQRCAVYARKSSEERLYFRSLQLCRGIFARILGLALGGDKNVRHEKMS